MKTFNEFLEKATSVQEAWIPPTVKRLRGGTMSPLSAARKRGTNTDLVRNSVHRFASPINDPRNPDIDYSYDNKSSQHSFTHKNHPIKITYTPGEEPNSFIQNMTTTGEVKNKVAAGSAWQKMRKVISHKMRPGTKVSAAPVGDRRGSLASRVQGMSEPNEQGVQSGIVRNRSPRQLARGARPMDPVRHVGGLIDPNH